MAVDGRLRKIIADAGTIRQLVQLIAFEEEASGPVCLAAVAALQNLAASHANSKAILAQNGAPRLQRLRDAPAAAVASGTKPTAMAMQLGQRAGNCMVLLNRAEQLFMQRQEKELQLQQQIKSLQSRTRTIVAGSAASDSAAGATPALGVAGAAAGTPMLEAPTEYGAAGPSSTPLELSNAPRLRSQAEMQVRVDPCFAICFFFAVGPIS